MEVHGVDMWHAAYRVSFRAEGRTIRGLVPEALIATAHRTSGRPEHHDAYAWIAANRRAIEENLLKLSRGETGLKAPYDMLSLQEER